MASLINPTLDVLLNDLNLQVQSTELILTSRLGYAGTSDMLATKDGLPIICGLQDHEDHRRASPLWSLP
jgi:hypothetical protein